MYMCLQLLMLNNNVDIGAYGLKIAENEFS